MSEVKFASEQEALQYLADVTGRRVVVAVREDEPVTVKELDVITLRKSNPEMAKLIEQSLLNAQEHDRQLAEIERVLEKNINEELRRLMGQKEDIEKKVKKSYDVLSDRLSELRDRNAVLQTVIVDFGSVVVRRPEYVSQRPSYKELFEDAMVRLSDTRRKEMQLLAQDAFETKSRRVEVEPKTASSWWDQLTEWVKRQGRRLLHLIGITDKAIAETRQLTRKLEAEIRAQEMVH